MDGKLRIEWELNCMNGIRSIEQDGSDGILRDGIRLVSQKLVMFLDVLKVLRQYEKVPTF